MAKQAPWWLPYAAGGGALTAVFAIAARKAFANSRSNPWDFTPPIRDGRITSGWWENRAYRHGKHEGIDISARVGTPVYAVGDGVIVQVDRSANDNAGLHMVIRHADGIYSRYLHLNDFAPVSHVGAHVRQGERIAHTGRSAHGMNAISTPHLHFDMAIDEASLPLYFKRIGAAPGPEGFGRRRAIAGVSTIAIPSEPFVAGVYSQRTARRAASFGVPMNARAVVV